MYQKILVALDGSTFGESAVPTALALAARSGASLELTMVAEPAASFPRSEPPGLSGESAVERGVREAADYLENVRQAIAGIEGDLPPLATHVEPPGNVARSIARRAVEEDADLIVLSTHGRGGLKRLWLGSTADALLRLTPSPVLLIRPNEEQAFDLTASVPDEQPFRQLVIPLDGSPAGEEALRHAAALLGDGPGALSVIRVVPDVPATRSPYLAPKAADTRERARLQGDARAYLEKVATELRERGDLTVEVEVASASQPATAVLDYATRMGADGIALSSRGRGGVARLLLGGVADKIIRGATLPVLVCRPPATE